MNTQTIEAGFKLPFLASSFIFFYDNSKYLVQQLVNTHFEKYKNTEMTTGKGVLCWVS